LSTFKKGVTVPWGGGGFERHASQRPERSKREVEVAKRKKDFSEKNKIVPPVERGASRVNWLTASDFLNRLVLQKQRNIGRVLLG